MTTWTFYLSITPDFDPPSMLQPSRVIFCHGKLYAANAYATTELNGGIHEITVNSNYDVISRRMVVPTPQPIQLGLGNVTEWGAFAAWAILGLACDPRDTDENFKLYFTLSPLYAQGGKQRTIPAPYYGKVRAASSCRATTAPGARCSYPSGDQHDLRVLFFSFSFRVFFPTSLGC